ncbi:MAG: DUF4127 family protein [Faecalicoccus sp.]|uniref:DUF4127 family protein n=1 Tax=Faecalicoccus sp. TaxID=1971758 RepID=UPI002F95207C
MKILYIPLDERPCNYKFPQMIVSPKEDIQLLVPDKNTLSQKKQPAKMEELWDFVEENIQYCEYAVLSLDMLLYGGLLPSRMHYYSKEVVNTRLERIKNLSKSCKIFAFQCIMRCPQYNSSEEEPDYYEEYGEQIFKRAYYRDKAERFKIDEIEKKELNNITIPDDIIFDYESRRTFNLAFNLAAVDLVKEGYVDTLVIPQDDSSEFGYTAISQKKVVDYVKKNNLEEKVFIYPGADEVGSSLLARILNKEVLNRTLKVYPFFSAVLGPTIVPLYEDRPILESLKHHVRIINGEIVENAEKADLILAYNTCGKVMQESFDQEYQDLSYTSYRNVLDFVLNIKTYIDKGYKVSICDSAFSNGSDLTLLKLLNSHSLLDKLYGYAGWNTNCNSLGTVLSMSAYGLDLREHKKLVKHLTYRYIEDGIYQAIVRQEVIKEVLAKNGLSYYDFKGCQSMVEEEILKRCQKLYENFKISTLYNFKIDSINMPWRRMFEIDLNLIEG